MLVQVSYIAQTEGDEQCYIVQECDANEADCIKMPG